MSAREKKQRRGGRVKHQHKAPGTFAKYSRDRLTSGATCWNKSGYVTGGHKTKSDAVTRGF